MRKELVFVIIFIALVASAAAYPVGIDVITTGSLFTQVASGSCTVSQSGKSYDLDGSGNCMVYEWVYQSCRGGNTGYVTTDDTTDYGPWPFTHTLSKVANCKSLVCCLSIDQPKVKVGTQIAIGSKVTSPLSFWSGGPQFAPDTLWDYYSVQTTGTLFIDGVQVNSATKKIHYGGQDRFDFSYAPITCGTHTVQIKTTVPDCQCSSSIEQSISGSFQTYTCQRDGIWGTDHQFQCNSEGTYKQCATTECSYDNINICDTHCGASSQCQGVTPGTNNCNAQCQYQQQNVCGDGTKAGNEQCEYPNTQNNNNCAQSTENCVGYQLQTRDSFGNCNSACGCVADYFGSASCVSGKCGASCTTDGQCNDWNSNTVDTCNQNSCQCEHTQAPYCGDGTKSSPEQCEYPNTDNNAYCSQSTTECQGHKLASRAAFGDCNSACGCVETPFPTGSCVLYQCGAQCSPYVSPPQCDDGNSNTVDSCGDDCMCRHVPAPYCGDGIVNTNTESCEYPSTNNNQNCGQTTTNCLNNKLGTRDSFGSCNSACGCVQDTFTYSCVKNNCGATCSTNTDCDDGNVHTTDTCLDSCQCQHTNIPYCGDGSIGTGEGCEYPNTNNNANCQQSTTVCQSTKTGTRDSYGNCNSVCGCVQDTFTYSCVKNSCGATCSTNADCDDGNAHTTDSCNLNTCGCEHTPIPYCGDGIVGTSESCEYPNTNNNQYCSQMTTSCQGTKTGTRDSYGNCNSACGCVQDIFTYSCVKNSCGAACSTNSDCDDGNVHTTDSCLNDCTCLHTPVPYCGDSIIGSGESCEFPNTNNNANCQQSTTVCQSTKTGTRDSYGNCNSLCGCTTDSFTYSCVKNSCGATCSTNSDCDDGNAFTTDNCNLNTCGCEHAPIPHCGDGAIGNGESCEFPNTNNNNYCTQNNKTCVGNKTATRDNFGNCNAQCGCTQDSFSASTCVAGSCGAECGSNNECGPASCKATYTDYCSGTKLVEYNTNKIFDSTNVSNSCQNSCTNGCQCTECTANCNAPQTQRYCVKGICGATCAIDSDCNDNNAYTTDSCNLNTCGCEHTPIPHCGDGVVSGSEQCELPSTNYNTYCAETNTTCNGHKFATRDTFGYCDWQCGCHFDNFTDGHCIQGLCGATCDCDADCNDNNAFTADSCNLNSCGCQHTPIPHCGDGIISGTEQCEQPNSNDNNYCAQNNSTCIGNKTASRDNFGNCDPQCGCTQDSFSTATCIKGKCNAQCSTDADCNDGNSGTQDSCSSGCTCEHIHIAHCGDNIITGIEQCELPNTENNHNCLQTTESCQGRKLATRDNYGHCQDDCGCSDDPFGTLTCVAGKCGASCSTNSDCNDEDSSTTDICLSDCSCLHNVTIECTQDGTWGESHEFVCDSDGTFDQCINGHYSHQNQCSEHCGSDIGCIETAPETRFDSCNKAGQTYLRDMCNGQCKLIDNQTSCEDGHNGLYTGCTSDPECRGIMPGTNGCNIQCRSEKLNITSLQCFDNIIKCSDQACSIYVESNGAPATNTTVKLYDANTGLSYGSCTTDRITGGCQIIYQACAIGHFTVYSTAEKNNVTPDLDHQPQFSYNVLNHRYDITNLRVYNDSAFTQEDYDFFRGENMYVRFQVVDRNDGNKLVPQIITEAALVSPPGGRVELTKIDSSNNYYYYRLTPIPLTHQFLGLSQVFTFAFNFTDNSGGEKVVNLTIRNNLPRILGNIGPLNLVVGQTITGNLTGHEFDLEDHGSDLTWSIIGANSTLYELTLRADHTFTVLGKKIGSNIVTFTMRDLDLDYASQTVGIHVGRLNHPPKITSSPDTSITEPLPERFTAIYNYDVVVSDPDGDNVTCYLSQKPTGMTMNLMHITWTPNKNQAGNNAVVIVCSDGQLSDTQAFSIDVISPKPDMYPRRKIHIDTIRMDNQEYAVVKAGDQMWVDLNFENQGMFDITHSQIRITVEGLGISRKIGPFNGPQTDEVLHKGAILDLPLDAKSGVYTIRVTITTDDGMQRIRHREITVVGK